MHGKTFDYKIPMKTFLRMFLLPNIDQRQVFFVMHLDPPVKQGQTRYPFLICSFDKEEVTTLDVALGEDEILERYGPSSKIKADWIAPTFEIISDLLETLVGRKITQAAFKGRVIAGSSSSGAKKIHAVAMTCSYKVCTFKYTYTKQQQHNCSHRFHNSHVLRFYLPDLLVSSVR
jgi:structure-specific recognition protein 1